ncbi:hypothetical protein HYALB_00001975 [Hymenoscyphus albidus]|uniref:Zinc-regulated transporter 1 n=1 Tax=Hymenoscyphus albidus TaxID=595503 RepID=A0A9N9PQZ9_9HELO|nr:hypothetical protein HYALB_00001975 [Hymenoscyphus albidus]
MSSSDFDPNRVNLSTADPREIICAMNAGENEYDGHIGARISAIFVIFFVSSFFTFFPVVASRVKWFKMNKYVYLFARYFGAGVIIATAFIHLLDPAYEKIGPASCVGMTGHWADYSWCPAIVLTSIMSIFLMDFFAEQYVNMKYGYAHSPDVEQLITATPGQAAISHQQLHSGDQDDQMHLQHSINSVQQAKDRNHKDNDSEKNTITPSMDDLTERSFRQQIAAFLILEFGVIFHSVIIGLNLGTTGPEFSTLYPVLVFHQSFEGLGIGARMSAIPFPARLSWLPWVLCSCYGLTTPIAIAIGLGLRTTYNAGSFTANVVSGVLDAISAGILIYTGLVELLARDFLFNPELTRGRRRLAFMVGSVFLGCGVMALLGKWA